MNKFAEALKRHQASELAKAVRSAAGSVGRSPDHPFEGNRATLSRWHTGTLPKYREVVVHIANVLGDESLVAAYDADKAVKTPRDVRNVLTRIRNLQPAARKTTLEALTRECLMAEQSTRANLTMRIDLHRVCTRWHRLDVELHWSGMVPAGATVKIAPDEDQLSDAFQIPECIFRELIPMAADDFAQAHNQVRSELPVMTYRDETSVRVTKRARPAHDQVLGSYVFDNPAVERADIDLSVRFAYPADVCFYGVVLGGYAVRGRSRVTMNMHDTNAQPHAVAFLPASERVEIRHGPLDRAVTTVELGDEDSVLAPGAGVAFYWQDAG
jgi:hypothetical protein